MRCYACHDYHYVTHHQALSVSERENRMCLRCHNPYQGHDWLPQKKAHFDFVECTTCHTSDVPHHIHLSFHDLLGNRLLSGNEILTTLGIDHGQFMPLVDGNQDGIIDFDEFDRLVLMLRQRNVHTSVHAELVAEMTPQVHRIRRGGGAEGRCEACHSARSPFFDAVTIVLSMDDGTVNHYQVERNVLESYHARHFYALGGTRMRLLDRIGFLLMAVGVFVVMAHLSIRVATIPLRRRERNGTKQQQENSH